MEKVSAFMDGELSESESASHIAHIREDAQSRAAWDAYHLIGDTLRGEKIRLSPDFNARLHARLADEPTVLAPHVRAPLQARVRRIALPIAASLGGVALVAWIALFNSPFGPPNENVALAPPVLPAAGVQSAARPASAQVNDYLLAHQQFSPSTTMRGVASYVLTVSGQGMEESR